MNREAQSIVVVLLGGLILAITVSGRFTAYVNPEFAPLLWVGGGILVLVGVWSLVEIARARLLSDPEHPSEDHGHDHSPDGADHGHDHDRSRAPWMILAPVLVLLVIAPPALGAESLARHAGSQALAGMTPLGVEAEAPAGTGALAVTGAERVVRDASGRATLEFGPLPEGAGTRLVLRELILRALYDQNNSVAETPVTVVGFVGAADEDRPGGWSLARVSIACCAADATALRVHVDSEIVLPLNTWVEAVVRAVPGTATPQNDYVPTVEIVTLTVIPQPAVPYE